MTPESTPAVADQIAGSEFITSLNADGETIRGVRYTVMGTQYDEAVDPWSATFLNPHEDQRAIVRNIPLQDGCPADFSDVVSFPYSPRAIDLTMQSLDPQSGITVRCTLHHPIS